MKLGPNHVRIHDAEVLSETDRAIKIRTDDPDLAETSEFWVPKSAISDDSDVWALSEDGAGPGDLIVASWLAERRGWI